MNKNDLIEFFKYHEVNEHQLSRMQAVRTKALELANLMDDSIVDCADKSAAIRHLRESVMEFNAAVSLQGHVTGYATPHRIPGPSFSETRT